MATVQPVDKSLGDRALGSDSLTDLFAAVNRIMAPVLKQVRAQLNDLLTQALNGTLTVGGTTITVGVGAPAAGLVGHVYIRTDGGAGTTLYVKEGAIWVGK
jgi:hypothetical protein